MKPLTAIMIGGFALALAEPLLTSQNTTPSLPLGYYLRTFSTPTYGSLVKFPLPAQISGFVEQHYPHTAEWSRQSGWFGLTGNGLLKPVVAVRGDVICRTPDDAFSVNGSTLGYAHRFTPPNPSAPQGHFLPIWQGCKTLSETELAVFTDFADYSLDSRYFGPINGAQASTYTPLFTWHPRPPANVPPPTGEP